MKSIRYIASGAVTLALIAATPVFADSDHKRDGDHKFGVNLGQIVKLLSDNNRDGQKHDKDKKDKEERKDHEKTMSATTSVSGTLASISGSTLTLTGAHGSTYIVSTSGATINGSTDVSLQLSKFQVGDRIVVRGTVSGSNVAAIKITNKSLVSREALAKFNGVRAGEVTAVNGSVITINRFGSGTTTVQTSGATFFAVGGSATTSAAVTLGSKILVFGPTTTGVSDTIQASVVLVIDHLKRLFH